MVTLFTGATPGTHASTTVYWTAGLEQMTLANVHP